MIEILLSFVTVYLFIAFFVWLNLIFNPILQLKITHEGEELEYDKKYRPLIALLFAFYWIYFIPHSIKFIKENKKDE